MQYREARQNDLREIIQLYCDDDLGTTREILSDPIDAVYLKAFDDISKDPNNHLYVIEDQEKVIGVMQYTVIAHLNRAGTKRAQIESVHIHPDYRNKGIGKKFMQFALDLAKSDGCGIVQLTSDKTRKDAHRFYADLGFIDSHIGMKIHI
ncbi:MAG: N-acetyltransferase family protein [Pseudomonadota bacterium]